MRDFKTCSMEPGNVSLKLKDGVATYKIFGYALIKTKNYIDYVELQPADLRKNPVFETPRFQVEELTVEW